MEIKRKVIKVSDKVIIEIDNPGGKIPRSRPDYTKLVRSNSKKLPISQFISLFPVLEVEYRRSYFELAPEIRMTVDHSIRYRKLFPLISKVGKEDIFASLLRNIPFRLFRHSKYVIGTDSVCVG
jgi:hypothetical protein